MKTDDYTCEGCNGKDNQVLEVYSYQPLTYQYFDSTLIINRSSK
jgi:hypothetical protein